ncbi:MAG: hypothetical protein HYT79_03430 [Elusimicrobia bacterium]|nr:hypothetical protein [Elusimicrobiota bacterium]
MTVRALAAELSRNIESFRSHLNAAGVLIDAGAVAIVGIAVLACADRPVFMLFLVSAVFGLRFFLWRLWVRRNKSHSMAAEIVFVACCAAIGAFNDWNSVDGHGVYHYRAALLFPWISTIPFWMLLYWGLILRFLASLLNVRKFFLTGPTQGGGLFKRAAFAGILVLLTRQAIYRFYADPWMSWLPFAAALLGALTFYRPGPLKIVILSVMTAMAVGTEILFIQTAGLHEYYLGVIGGAPVWIMLWWFLAFIVWGDLSVSLLGLIRIAGQKFRTLGASQPRIP